MAHKIIDIEGIGPVYAETLLQAGIRTVEALLKTAASKAGRKALTAQTGLSETLLLRWVNMADLFRVKGVGEEFSDLLEAAGVDTVKELRKRVPEKLHAKMAEVNAAKGLAGRNPHLSEVRKWVEAAKALEPKVTH